MMKAVKYLLSLSYFIVTMMLGLFLFTYTAIHFPTTMRSFLTAAKVIRDQISNVGLSDNYMVWVDIFLQPNQIILILFSTAMRVGMDLTRLIFNGGRFPGSGEEPSPSTSSSPFTRWG